LVLKSKIRHRSRTRTVSFFFYRRASEASFLIPPLAGSERMNQF